MCMSLCSGSKSGFQKASLFQKRLEISVKANLENNIIEYKNFHFLSNV